MSAKHLYTAGYEGLDIDAFIARLKLEGVSSIIDVRELPLSRKKGFSKTALSERLKAAGIGYFHAPQLGCPKEIRNRYRADNDWAAYTRDFLAYLETQGKVVRELARFARSTSACLLCFEADYDMCHRTYVARAAQRAGAPAVRHITARATIADRPVRLVA
jgi:uncharacterized protein (DUF488 family)